MSDDLSIHFAWAETSKILKSIWGGLQKQIVTELPISPEMRVAICLKKLKTGDYYCTNGKLVGIAQSTVCRINKKSSIF